MTDSNDKQQPDSSEQATAATDTDNNRASHDLSAAVEEAMRLVNENKPQPDAPSDDTSGTETETDTESTAGVPDHTDTASSESVVAADNIPDNSTGQVDVNMVKMADKASQDSVEPTDTTQADAVAEENGNTTNDLEKEAIKARAIEDQRKREAIEKARKAVTERGLFTKEMRLKLESGETADAIIKDVDGELIVGRADNVTDYVPEIDLTPHGAYRLGLSRRHAIILRENERVLVRDLNSRNGTFVNGAIVPGGGTMVLRDGDELRFGNLAMKVSFISDTDD